MPEKTCVLGCGACGGTGACAGLGTTAIGTGMYCGCPAWDTEPLPGGRSLGTTTFGTLPGGMALGGMALGGAPAPGGIGFGFSGSLPGAAGLTFDPCAGAAACV